MGYKRVRGLSQARKGEELEDSAKSPVGPVFMIAMVAVTLTGPLSVHVFIPALPIIRRAFEIDAPTAQLMLSIALFTMAASTLLYGSLSDRYGRRPVLVAGILLFLVGTGLCAVADSVTALVVGRFVQAAGAGCGLVLARASVRDVYGDDKLVKMTAYLTMAYVLGPMLAPAIGGVLIDEFGWRAIFYMALAGAVAILLLTVTAIHETAPGRSGGGGFARMGRDYARLACMPRFLGDTFFNGFVSASFFAYITAASYIMTEVLERPAAEYGLWFLTLPAAYLLGNFVAGRFGGRARIDFMVLLGGGIALASALVFVFAAAIMPLTPLSLFLPCFIASIGQGIAMPNAQSGAIMVDPELTGTASGTVMFAHLCIGATGAQVMGFLADGTMLPMALMYVACNVLAMGAALVPALIRETQPAAS